MKRLRNRLTEILLLVVLLGCIQVSDLYAQDETSEVPPLRDRLFFGGNFGLQFGSVTDIQISPVAGIWLLPRVAVALGPNYRYYKGWNGKTSIYGAKAYTQFNIIQDLGSFIPVGSQTSIFAHLENELLSLESAFWKTYSAEAGRFYVNTILAGGGISQKMGRRASIDIMVLWPLNEPLYSIYSSPEIRVCFLF